MTQFYINTMVWFVTMKQFKNVTYLAFLEQRRSQDHRYQ